MTADAPQTVTESSLPPERPDPVFTDPAYPLDVIVDDSLRFEVTGIALDHRPYTLGVLLRAVAHGPIPASRGGMRHIRVEYGPLPDDVDGFAIRLIGPYRVWVPGWDRVRHGDNLTLNLPVWLT